MGSQFGRFLPILIGRNLPNRDPTKKFSAARQRQKKTRRVAVPQPTGGLGGRFEGVHPGSEVCKGSPKVRGEYLDPGGHVYRVHYHGHGHTDPGGGPDDGEPGDGEPYHLGRAV